MESWAACSGTSGDGDSLFMSAGEFEDLYLRYLRVQRDFPHLDHRGHFDEAILTRWETLLEEPTRLRTSPSYQMSQIDREFNRSAS